MPLFEGFLIDALGAAIASATVDLLDRNTTTPVRATTTTNVNGFYSINHGTEGRFDIRITSGADVLFRKYDTSAQTTEIELATLKIRNPADTFAYDIVPAAIVAARTLTLPLIVGADTLVTLGLDQTFTATINNTSQPAFSAYLGTSQLNATGNGTIVTVNIDTEIFDQNADFASNTFTAPVTGRYLFTVFARLTGGTVSAASCDIRLNSSNRIWEARQHIDGAITVQGYGVSAIIDMDAADTVTFDIRVTGEASDLTDISGASFPQTFFTGMLLA